MQTKKISVALALAPLALTIANSPVLAKGIDQPFMPGGESADAPEGFIDMCRVDRVTCAGGLTLPAVRSGARPSVVPALCITENRANPGPDDCTLGTTGSVAPMAQRAAFDRDVVLTAPRRAQAVGASGFEWIKQVNKDVNHNAIQRTDDALYGVGELWRRPSPGRHPTGDCEDLAIEKRMRLLEQGFPAERLFLAVTYRKNVGLHTVTVARLDDGDYVLDSYTPHVKRWDKTGYVWLRQQSTYNPMLWTRVNPGTPTYIVDRGSSANAPS